MSDGPLLGSVALVTGAARPRGIGRATALALAMAGADVNDPSTDISETPSATRHSGRISSTD